MAIMRYSSLLLISVLVSIRVQFTSQLQSSQSWSLLRLQRLLHYPTVLRSWNNYTDFCNSEPTPLVVVGCYEESVTQLHIIGSRGSPPLPKSFSIESFFTTLVSLPNLKVLTLASLGLWGPLPSKISRLSSLEIVNMSSNYLYGGIPKQVSDIKSLQTIIFDHNMLTGPLPDWLCELPLAVISLRNNSLTGSLPDSLRSMKTLRVLVLSMNNFSGDFPNLGDLTNLQVLDLGNNYFGPHFPVLDKKVLTIVLRKNRFSGGLPSELSSFYLLEHLDLSSNGFVGPFPPSLLSLPSIHYLNVSGNRFSGMLFQNMSCNNGLEVVDLSSNLMTGDLPECLNSKSKGRIVQYSFNCFATKEQGQHPYAQCSTQAIAAGILPHKQKASTRKTILVIGVIIGVLGATLFTALLFLFVIKKANAQRTRVRLPTTLIEQASNGYTSKILSDARYISQTIKLGALGIPPYRSFSLDELEAATNYFESSYLIGEGSHGQMFRGRLRDGSLVAIKCLKLKKSHSSQNFNRHIELISKLRHRQLVSALGHCFEYNLEDSTTSRLYLIFEYVSNGTFRSNISERRLTWTQRLAAVTGVVRGIQFLHAGIIPGLFGNDLKTTNILLDQNFMAKISSYNLPVLSENMKNEVLLPSSSSGIKESDRRLSHADKMDIYDFGVILLEIISGKPITTHEEVDPIINQLQEYVTADWAAKGRSVIDPTIWQVSSDESLKTVMEICIRCLSKEPTARPSVEDVLWNLQFATQVQDAWRGDSRSSEETQQSPSPSPIPWSPLFF